MVVAGWEKYCYEFYTALGRTIGFAGNYVCFCSLYAKLFLKNGEKYKSPKRFFPLLVCLFFPALKGSKIFAAKSMFICSMGTQY